jgi:O-antigen biosynthesis protein
MTSFKRKVKYFLLYTEEFGLFNAMIFSFYKLFPKMFVLMHRQLNATNQSIWPEMAAIDPVISLGNVLDYKNWQEFGGSSIPQNRDINTKTFIWFVPDWLNVWGGGHLTLFKFANHFSSFGTRNIIYIYNNERHETSDALQSELDNALVNCKLEVIVDPKKLPSCDGAIATTWQSAYDVKAFPFAKKKFYFMQDYEGLFYAYGTASMQANATYTFGFAGITGGAWLRKCYESHGGTATNYHFSADRSIFFPNDINGKVRDKVTRVFFYGRPSTERRCFDLGMSALNKIAENYPEVEIVIAGLDMTAKPPFPATMLGNRSLKETGDLYRSCDIGIAFSGTNLSYLPVELMASGVPVISNNGPHVEWHCENRVNSLLCDPTPTSVLEAFSELYESRELRQTIVDGGLERMKSLDWEDQMTKIYEYVSYNLK